MMDVTSPLVAHRAVLRAGVRRLHLSWLRTWHVRRQRVLLGIDRRRSFVYDVPW